MNFCKATDKIPGLNRAMNMFCSKEGRNLYVWDQQDRFLTYFLPVFALFIGIPWTWWLIKQVYYFTIYCCIWEVYVDEEEEDDSSNQPPEDDFVQKFNFAAQNLVSVGPISSLIDEHFYVVLEQLEELEDVQGSL